MEQHSGSLVEKIRQIVKDQIVMRHRKSNELPGEKAECMLCHRIMEHPPGSLSLVISNEGPVCPVCAELYAPEMVAAFKSQLSGVVPESAVSYVNSAPVKRQAVSLQHLAEELTAISEQTNILARGIARGIIEAPAGHIGLLHYAKDIQKPERREGESERDYDLRVRSHRINHLYEKIHADTTGRILKVAQELDALT